MYRMIVVDDEEDVRNRVISMINAVTNDFEIVNTFDNGIDAFNFLQNEDVDLVVTDIKLPYLDGIGLVSKVRAIGLMTKVIIITGFDLFDYAKKSIDLGVSSFITKPVTKDDLKEAIDKVKNALDMENRLVTDMNSLVEFRNQSLPLVVDNDLCRLVSMDNVDDEFIKKLNNDGINIEKGPFYLGIFDSDKRDETIDFLHVQKYLQDFLNIKHYLFTRNDKLLILITSETSSSKIERTLSSILNRINKNNCKSISVGIASSNDYNFKALHNKAKKALEYRTSIGGGRIIFYDDISTDSSFLALESGIYRNLAYSIVYEDISTVKKQIDDIMSYVNKKEYINSVTSIYISTLNAIIGSCTDTNKLTVEYYNSTNLYLDVINLKTVDEAQSFFIELALNVKKINEETRTNSFSNSLKLVIEYLETHYRDFDLTLDSLSDAINLSVSYVSSLLKSIDTTFVKYLTQLRMERAKILLKDKNNKIINVSEEVGYNDPYYFSHCFKKYVGLSPREYRNSEK